MNLQSLLPSANWFFLLQMSNKKEKEYFIVHIIPQISFFEYFFKDDLGTYKNPIEHH